MCLTLVHALFTALGVEAMARAGLFARRGAPLADTAPIAAAYVASIVLSNWSIQLNTVRGLRGNKTSRLAGLALALCAHARVCIFACGFGLLADAAHGLHFEGNSLLLRHPQVGFYQVCKVLITPTLMGIELVWLRKVPGRGAVVSTGVLLAGISVATLLDKQVRGARVRVLPTV